VGAVSHADDTLTQLTELLSQDEVSGEALDQQMHYLRESHSLALSNLRRAADLVQRFKRTSIDRGSQQKRAYRLHEVIDDVLTTLRNTLKRTSIGVEVDCSEDLEVYGTPGLLEQVLTNLITNSIAHGFDNGTRSGQITIKTKLSNTKRLIIDFQDNGVGMTEEVRQKAFEPFFTTYREHGGSGLGLYVIYNIITQQMAGMIQIDSTPSLGTRFHIDCPIDAGPVNQ
jgi:signal transduction histidine kinase